MEPTTSPTTSPVMTKKNALRFDYDRLEELIKERGLNLNQAFKDHPNGRKGYWYTKHHTDMPLSAPITYLIRELNLSLEEFCSLWLSR